jgi:hypothetical protein
MPCPDSRTSWKFQHCRDQVPPLKAGYAKPGFPNSNPIVLTSRMRRYQSASIPRLPSPRSTTQPGGMNVASNEKEYYSERQQPRHCERAEEERQSATVRVGKRYMDYRSAEIQVFPFIRLPALRHLP